MESLNEHDQKMSPMTYRSTLRYLFSKLPMYQRIGRQAFKKDLTNIIALCEHLGKPHKAFKSIHIAGTNGKGSTAHGLAAILQAHGLKVGLYTSPHYKDFRERIKINGSLIPEEEVVNFVEENKLLFDEIKPSFFEITVALAFHYFAQQQVDIAIIETGLGGRLDSTNIITPLLSVITNISFDHMELLGNDLPTIAKEKAGIIKQGVPVVIGETNEETAPVFIAKAKAEQAQIYFADQDLRAENVVQTLRETSLDVFAEDLQLYKSLKSDLTGTYQQKNLLTILRAMDILPDIGVPIRRCLIKEALAGVRQSVRFIGRWQILQNEPLVVADSAHNPAGIAHIVEQLEALTHDHLHMVIGAVNDKDLSKILVQLPKNATYYFCKPEVPRGLPAAALGNLAAKYDLEGSVYESVDDALENAKRAARKNDLIFVGGSTFVVAEVV